MKKVPVFVVLIGCVFSWLIASMNPVTKIILFVGIILLWFIKRKEQ